MFRAICKKYFSVVMSNCCDITGQKDSSGVPHATVIGQAYINYLVSHEQTAEKKVGLTKIFKRVRVPGENSRIICTEVVKF